jgi:serine/threonine protein kinase
MTEESLFHQVLEQPAERRATFLEQACAGDAALRRRLEVLLHAHNNPGTFLGRPVVAPLSSATVSPPPEDGAFGGRSRGEGPGSRIGPYKLLQQIGEGGMGAVWMAEQQEPVQRRVAVKIIKPGMDSALVIARLQAERQALALMDHPNIARILDAGTTASGRPYFVMELVKGMSISRYCDERRLTPRERLELFIPVSQAMQHAHQKGIIHRDLKPSNVLVALYDGKPVPKVIDFGVAKATGPRLTEKTLFTEFGAVVGTLEYMSPEQAELNNFDIDTRSDIYTLGVLLYELLTGTTPLEQARVGEVPLLEVLRVIREEDPPTPSNRLSTTAELPGIAANRGLEPRKLSGLVRGELDWIVMKALEKDRCRRYETANELALDLQRYLADEPVLACPPSTTYRLGKFVRRNKRPVLVAGVAVLALVGGILGTTAGLVWAERARQAEAEQRRLAQANEQKAVAAAEAEKEAREQAQKRLRQIEKGNEILTSVFTDLDPREEKKLGKPLRVILGERLTRAAEQLEGEEVGDPLVMAGLQTRLAQSLYSLGMPERAVPLFAKARATRAATQGPDHPDTLVSTNNLAGAYEAAGKLDQALPLWEETVRAQKALLGADHPETLRTMNNLGDAYRAAGKTDQALALLEETLRVRKAKLGADHASTLTSMTNLALAYDKAGKPEEALPLLEEVFRLRKAKLGADHPDTLKSMNNLGSVYRAADQLDKALPLMEEAFRLRKAKLGADHPDTLRTMNNLAGAYQAAGKTDQALLLWEETVRLLKVRLGADHPDTLSGMNNLALGYEAADKLEQAVPLLEETLRRRKAKLGADHPDTLTSLNNLAGAYLAAGTPEQGLPLYREAAAGVEARRFQHEHAGRIVNNLIQCQERLGKLGQAEAWRRKWLAVVRERSGADSLPYADVLADLGSNLLRQNRAAEAEGVLRECLAVREKRQPEAWGTFHTRSLLGEALLGQKKYAEAEAPLRAGYDGLKQREATIPSAVKGRLTEALRRVVRLYEAWGKPDAANAWRANLPPKPPDGAGGDRPSSEGK